MNRSLGIFGKAFATIVVRNSGMTPAYGVHHWAEIKILLPKDEHTLVVGDDRIGDMNATPKDGLAYKYLTTADIVSEQDAMMIKSGQKRLFVHGRIDYKDVFGEVRWTNYRLSFSGAWPPQEGAQMTFCVHGNETS